MTTREAVCMLVSDNKLLKMMGTFMNDMYTDRKEQIIYTALQLVSEQGMKNLTMKNIADVIGFSDAALYRHFKSKHDILETLIDTVSKNLINKINDAVASIDDPVEKLRVILRIHLSHIEKNTGMPRIIFSESIHQNDPALRNKVLQTVSKYLDVIRDVLHTGQKEGKIRTDLDIDAAAVAYFGLVQSTTLIWSLSDFSYSIEEKCEAIFNVFEKGIY